MFNISRILCAMFHVKKTKQTLISFFRFNVNTFIIYYNNNDICIEYQASKMFNPNLFTFNRTIYHRTNSCNCSELRVISKTF